MGHSPRTTCTARGLRRTTTREQARFVSNIYSLGLDPSGKVNIDAAFRARKGTKKTHQCQLGHGPHRLPGGAAWSAAEKLRGYGHGHEPPRRQPMARKPPEALEYPRYSASWPQQRMAHRPHLQGRQPGRAACASAPKRSKCPPNARSAACRQTPPQRAARLSQGLEPQLPRRAKNACLPLAGKGSPHPAKGGGYAPRGPPHHLNRACHALGE